MRALAPIKSAFALAERERKFLVSEMPKVKGLMPVLMKRRNKQKWTPEDIAEIRSQVRRISKITPYLVVVVMPGGFVVLPVLAWWLDRRRGQRATAAAPPKSG